MATKKIPLRMCIGCRCRKPKNELLRIVKSPEGSITFDPTQKMPGRGTYICTNPECFEKIMKTKALARAFRVTIPDEVQESLFASFNSLRAQMLLDEKITSPA